MSIELGTSGIPPYYGKPEHFAEHKQRCFDLYDGGAGKPEHNAIALRLRSGFNGPAYEAVRKLKHEDLLTSGEDGHATIGGLKLPLASLKKQDIAPVRSTEIFDTALHELTVWRQRNESTTSNATRRW